jgi:hypothetical protein
VRAEDELLAHRPGTGGAYLCTVGGTDGREYGDITGSYDQIYYQPDDVSDEDEKSPENTAHSPAFRIVVNPQDNEEPHQKQQQTDAAKDEGEGRGEMKKAIGYFRYIDSTVKGSKDREYRHHGNRADNAYHK